MLQIFLVIIEEVTNLPVKNLAYARGFLNSLSIQEINSFSKFQVGTSNLRFLSQDGLVVQPGLSRTTQGQMTVCDSISFLKLLDTSDDMLVETHFSLMD